MKTKMTRKKKTKDTKNREKEVEENNPLGKNLDNMHLNGKIEVQNLSSIVLLWVAVH